MLEDINQDESIIEDEFRVDTAVEILKNGRVLLEIFGLEQEEAFVNAQGKVLGIVGEGRIDRCIFD